MSRKIFLRVVLIPDEDFGHKPKSPAPVDKPPYYALPLYPGGPNTKGGISANAKRGG